MPKEIKSLVACSQDVLARHLDFLDDVGRAPYSLLREALCKATPQQLDRIERINPHLIPESIELWLPHCLSFSDIREAYNQDVYPEFTDWRQLYHERVQENERRRQMARAKMKKEYNKIQSEKAAKSIKVLSGVVPIQGRKTTTYEAAKRSTTSKLFRETRKAAERTHAIYKSKPSPSTVANQRPQRLSSMQTTTTSSNQRPGSALTRAYNSLYEQQHMPPRSPIYRPLVQPPPRISSPAKNTPSSSPSSSECIPTTKKPRLNDRNHLTTSRSPRPNFSSNRRQSESASSHDNASTAKRPVAIVNFDIFKQLS
ncbi:predicted protein [Lichtheimia corymbifera JMRC:FSU:9682]|uniref:Elongin-A n=1 Tax=Lichtheimia corymbifera JMRC:FSU:9682 TaxID=1263082 RepID=A0A068S579_9FUNG|nr:predicted protein [Lichtheimia corymbifera JMRC:FSU:9682]